MKAIKPAGVQGTTVLLYRYPIFLGNERLPLI